MQDLLQEIALVLQKQRDMYGNLRFSVPDLSGEAGRTDDVSVGDEEPPSESVLTPSQMEPQTPVVRNQVADPERQEFGPTVDGDKPVEEAAPMFRIEALIPDGHPVKSMTNLGDLEKWVSSAVLVPIDESRLNPVFGTGNPSAELMVIGEAPGADEDRKGEPFVGAAGQLLNKILAAVKFSREEVYIANILKSRPPGNRNPEPNEIEAHIPVLYKQIALVQPKMILVLGKVAAVSLFSRTGSLASFRQTVHDFFGIPTVVTYHPAALLRNPQWKRPVWDDVRMLRDQFDHLVNQTS